MSTATETKEPGETAASSKATPAASEPFRYPNGQTEEQVQYTLAALGRRKRDPEYLKRWEEGVAEYRRQIQEEVERDLAAEGK